MFKKVLSSVLCLVFVLTIFITGCGQEQAGTPTEDESTDAQLEETTQPPDVQSGSSAADADKEKEIYKVGLITGFTGIYAFGSGQIRNGIEMALEEYGQDVLGKKIVLSPGDATDAAQTMSELERLYSQDVRVFFGCFGSINDLTLAPVVDDKGVMLLTCTGNSIKLTEEKHKNLFHVTPTIIKFSKSCAEAVTYLGEKYLNKSKDEIRVGVVYNINLEYHTTPLLDAFKEMGVNVVFEEGYPVDRTDFTSTIEQLRAADVDIFVPLQQSIDGIPFRKKMVELGYEPPITCGFGDVYDQPDFAELGADMIDGLCAVSYTHPGMNPEIANGLEGFKERYLEKYGYYPLTHAVHAYAGAMFFIDMVKEAGTFDFETVRQTIENADIPPGTYPNYWGIQFDEWHRNTRAAEPVAIGQWRNGELVVIGPDDLAVQDAILPWEK